MTEDLRWMSWVFVLMTGMAMVRAAASDDPRQPPDVIFFLADDLGWTDLGCFGSTFYETPVLDQLAATGVMFTNAAAL
jgi:arylsulfatase A-like enzyme